MNISFLDQNAETILSMKSLTLFACMIVYKRGQLISEGNFGVFKSSYYCICVEKRNSTKSFFFLETKIFFKNVNIDILKLYSMNKEAHY